MKPHQLRCIWGLTLSIMLGYQAAAQSVEDIIREKMQKQQDCWNQADLQCFMVGYWESDSLMFIGKDRIYYGYQNTLQRYQQTYPDQESMGTLKFEFISMQPLGRREFFVVGAYYLTRSVGDLSGHFTLLWRKIEGEWVIVADHSS